MTSFCHEETACPGCGALLNAALPMEGQEGPKAGDVSICAECGSLLEYTAQGVKALPEETWEGLSVEKRGRLRYAQELWRRFNRAP